METISKRARTIALDFGASESSHSENSPVLRIEYLVTVLSVRYNAHNVNGNVLVKREAGRGRSHSII